MARSIKIVGLLALVTAAMVGLLLFAIPGCTQNQDNFPISISQGRPALYVACSADGAVAYVTEGRNVYRSERANAGRPTAWECILSQGERLEMAAQHDPREQQVSAADAQRAGTPKQPEKTADRK